jgi:hypothetical protein
MGHIAMAPPASFRLSFRIAGTPVPFKGDNAGVSAATGEAAVRARTRRPFAFARNLSPAGAWLPAVVDVFFETA